MSETEYICYFLTQMTCRRGAEVRRFDLERFLQCFMCYQIGCINRTAPDTLGMDAFPHRPRLTATKFILDRARRPESH